MKKEKNYINTERFKEELSRQYQHYHPKKRMSNGRKIRLWVQDDLCFLCGLSKTRFSVIINGHAPVQDSTLHLLCDAWDISADWLIGRSEYRDLLNQWSSENERLKDNIFTELDYLQLSGFTVTRCTPENVTIKSGSNELTVPIKQFLYILNNLHSVVSSSLNILFPESDHNACGKTWINEIDEELSENVNAFIFDYCFQAGFFE